MIGVLSKLSDDLSAGLQRHTEALKEIAKELRRVMQEGMKDGLKELLAFNQVQRMGFVATMQQVFSVSSAFVNCTPSSSQVDHDTP